jgi:hypothetical protein
MATNSGGLFRTMSTNNLTNGSLAVVCIDRNGNDVKTAEPKRKCVQRPRHVMPGLARELAAKFRTPRRHFTVLALQQDTKVAQGPIISGLLHELFNRVERLEKDYNAISVRQYRERAA